MVGKCDFRLHDWIDGKYKVERVLGHSNSDSRFKVADRTGRQYTLTLHNLWQVEPALQEAMSRRSESEIASCAIPSNYLAQIVGRGMVEGNPYLLTEYTLANDLSRVGKLRGEELCNVLVSILYGLKDLHDNGKVHGSLIPENVLLTNDGRVLLTNFVMLGDRNMILTERTSTRSRQLSSEALILPAERYVDDCSATILPTVDIFAFGIIAFRLLTGLLPFGTANNSAEYVARVREGRWNRSLLSHESAAWGTLFDKLLTADPSARPGSVEEVIKLLPFDHIPAYKPSDDIKKFETASPNGLLLRVMQGAEYGKVYRLTELFAGHNRRILSVGREDSTVFNHLGIMEDGSNYISRHHSTIELDDKTGKVYVRDGQWEKEAGGVWINSLNGTFVNSTRVSEEGAELHAGDILALGDVKLRVEGY